MDSFICIVRKLVLKNTFIKFIKIEYFVNLKETLITLIHFDFLITLPN